MTLLTRSGKRNNAMIYRTAPDLFEVVADDHYSTEMVEMLPQSLGRENETITIVNRATVNVKECYPTTTLAYIKHVDFRMISLALPF